MIYQCAPFTRKEDPMKRNAVLPIGLFIAAVLALVVLCVWRAHTMPAPAAEQPTTSAPSRGTSATPPGGGKNTLPRAAHVERAPLAVPPQCDPIQEALRNGESADMIRLLSIDKTSCSQAEVAYMLGYYSGAQSEKIRSAAIVGVEAQARKHCRANREDERARCQRSHDAADAYGNCIRLIYDQPNYLCVSDYFERLNLTTTRQEHQARELEPHCNLGLEGAWDRERGQVNDDIDRDVAGDPESQARVETFRAEIGDLSVELCGHTLGEIDPRFAPWQALGLPDQAAFVAKYVVPWLNAEEIKRRLSGDSDPLRAERQQRAAAWGLIQIEGTWVPAPSQQH